MSLATLLLVVLWVAALVHLLLGLGVWKVDRILRSTGEGVDQCLATQDLLIVLPLNGSIDMWGTDTWTLRSSFGNLSTEFSVKAHLAFDGKRLVVCEDDVKKKDDVARSVSLIDPLRGRTICSHRQSIFGDVALKRSGAGLVLTEPLRLINPEDGASLPVTNDLAAASDECARKSGRQALSPDGRCLLLVSRSVLSAWEPFAGVLLWTIVVPDEAEVQDVGFSNDGKLCAIDCGRGVIKLYSTLEGRHVTDIRLPSAEHHLRLYSFCASDSRLGFQEENGTVRLYGLNGELITVRNGIAGHMPCFLGQGKQIAVPIGPINTIEILDSETGKTTSVVSGDDCLWIANCSRLVAIDADRTRIFIYEQVRPSTWWGVMMLPSFWALILATLIVVWSFRRDVCCFNHRVPGVKAEAAVPAQQDNGQTK
jgi:WD40 repeat protein